MVGSRKGPAVAGNAETRPSAPIAKAAARLKKRVLLLMLSPVECKPNCLLSVLYDATTVPENRCRIKDLGVRLARGTLPPSFAGC